jgi:hypothetical protein
MPTETCSASRGEQHAGDTWAGSGHQALAAGR